MFPQPRRNETLRNEIAEYREQFKKQQRRGRSSDQFPMRPERILADVSAVLPRDAFITTDVGWNKNGVGQQFPIYEPGSILTPGGFATMGFGAPAALGAKIARPDRVVVSLVGDGGFGQNPVGARDGSRAGHGRGLGRDEQSCVRHDRGAREGALRHDVRHRVSARTVQPYSPNFAAIAQAYGVDSVRIESADQFKPALEQAVQMRQALSCSTSSWKMRRFRRRVTGTSWTSIRRIRSERTSRREPGDRTSRAIGRLARARCNRGMSC